MSNEKTDTAARIDEIVRAVEDASGPSPFAPRQAHPNMGVTIDQKTGQVSEVEYKSPQDAALAAQRAAESQDLDITDGVSLEHSYKQLLGELQREQARLDEHYFDRQTGAKEYAVQGAARDALQRRVATLGEAAVYQHDRYGAALAARADKAELAEGQAAAERMGDAWTSGDPKRRAIYAEEMLREEARALAQVAIRVKLGLPVE